MTNKRYHGRCEIKPKTRGNGNEADFRLRDYLSPGGRYPYADLAGDLEAALADGFTVYLFSVPGFMMLAGHPSEPGCEDLEPWHVTDAGDEYHKTAAEALRV